MGKGAKHMQKFLASALIAGFLVVFGIWGYNRFLVSEVASDISIEKDNMKSLDVNIHFGYGDISITDGADGWIEGTIDTNKKKLQPTVSYKKKRTVGNAVIKQEGKMLAGLKSVRNNWDLKLTNEIPVDLDIEMGVSDSTLNLSGIQLSNLSIDAGVSDTTIDLSGDWKDSFKANINLGVGDATILLPTETGVKLTVSKGIGSIGAKGFISKGNGVYVNEAYEKSDVLINLKIDLGLGDLTIKLAN